MQSCHEYIYVNTLYVSPNYFLVLVRLNLPCPPFVALHWPVQALSHIENLCSGRLSGTKNVLQVCSAISNSVSCLYEDAGNSLVVIVLYYLFWLPEAVY